MYLLDLPVLRGYIQHYKMIDMDKLVYYIDYIERYLLDKYDKIENNIDLDYCLLVLSNYYYFT